MLIGNNGIWGTRAADMAARFRGESLETRRAETRERERRRKRSHSSPSRSSSARRHPFAPRLSTTKHHHRPPTIKPNTAEVIELKAEPGRAFSADDIKAALARHRPAALFLVQGESSTGAHQALGGGLGAACREAGALLIVDAVASLGGARPAAPAA